MKKTKLKTISSSITLPNILLVSAALVLFSIICLSSIYTSSSRMMINGISNAVKGKARYTETIVRSYKQICYSLGTLKSISNPDIPISEKKEILEQKSKELGLRECNLISTKGFSLFDGAYKRDRDYFQSALEGKITISDPFYSVTSGELVITVAGPVWKNGIQGDEIVAVIFCVIPSTRFHATLSDDPLSYKSTTTVLASDGTVVYTEDIKKVQRKYNLQREALKNPKLEKLAEVEQNAISGKKQIQKFWRDVSHCVMVSSPITESPGWVLTLETPYSEHQKLFYFSLIFFTISIVIIITTIVIHTRSLSRKISESVLNAADRLRKAAVGDFTSAVNSEESLEEVKLISDATQKLVSRMFNVIEETSLSSINTNVFSLFEINEYAELNNNFAKVLHVGLCVFDKFGNKLMGIEPDYSDKGLYSHISVNQRIVGKYYIEPKKDCVLERNELQIIIDSFSCLVGTILENLISREERFKAWQKNEKINISNFITDSEDSINNFRQVISQSQSLIPNAQKTKLEEIISEITEITEYARFVENKNQIEENDYRIQRLINRITDFAKLKINNNSLSFSADIPLPEKLFGDKDAIEQSINRVLFSLAQANPNSSIRTNFSANEEGLGAVFATRILVDSPKISMEVLQKVKNLSLTSDRNGEVLSAFEQQILSAFKRIYTMNGTIDLDSDETTFLSLNIFIPQLIAKNN